MMLGELWCSPIYQTAGAVVVEQENWDTKGNGEAEDNNMCELFGRRARSLFTKCFCAFRLNR